MTNDDNAALTGHALALQCAFNGILRALPPTFAALVDKSLQTDTERLTAYLQTGPADAEHIRMALGTLSTLQQAVQIRASGGEIEPWSPRH